MTSTFSFRTLTVFLASVLTSTYASAQISPKLYAYTAEGATVEICMDLSFFGDCARSDCNDVRHFLTIEPCPPGVPCDGGVSHVDFGGYCREPLFTFAYGTRYVISGYSDVKTGRRVGACTYTCVTRTPAGSIEYQVPRRDEVARWRVAPVEAAGSNVWVNVDIESDYMEHNWCYPHPQCPRHHSQVTVSPCPLEARQYLPGQVDPVDVAVNCVGETATFDLYSYLTPDPTLQVLLAPGEYTVDGYWFSRFGLNDDECYLLVCTFGAYPAPISFNSATLPVRSATWGQVKALYRD